MPIDRDKVIQAAQKLVEKKRYDKAVLEYQRIIQEDPNDARTLLKIGDLQLKMEAYGDAIATYERVGRYYSAQGFSLKAIAVYKQIREILHKHVPQLEERYAHIAPKLAELYQQLGLVSDALAALEELAVRHQRAGRDGEAIQMFRKIVDLDPSNPLPHLRLAEALSRAQATDDAAAEFGIAAAQLVKHNRRDDALKVLERLLHHKADPVQARLAAELYLGRGQPNDGMQALSKLQICFQANPKDLDTLGLLARAFAAIGQASKGIEVHKEMARIARDQGKLDTFRELVTKLEKMAPNDDAVKQLSAQAATGLATTTTAEPVRQPSLVPEEEIAEVDDEELISYHSFAPPPMANDGPEAAPEMEVGDTVEGSALDEETAARAAEVAMIVEEAAQLKARRQLAKAIDRLRVAIDLDPRLVDTRATMRSLLLEAGRTGEAVEEMLAIASLQLESLDGESAARTLEEVLAIDPINERAVATLRELGYDVELPGDLPAESGAISSEELEPLPAYDLDDAGDEQARASRTSAISADEAPKPWETIDSPFGESAPLPSFALDEPPDLLDDSAASFDRNSAPAPAASESDAAFELVRGSSPSPAIDEIPDAPDSRTAVDQLPPSIAARGAVELEDALEEAEFFASRGLYDDARAVLTEQLARAPNHPLLVERMTELDTTEQTAHQSSGTRQMPLGGEDRSFDIAASLDALESLEAPSVREAVESQVDVEEVFAKFKEGVEKIISVDDAQSHYDLGVAYKEMDRIADSIREFAVAARDPKRTCVCESMIGTIYMERGEIGKAVEAFQRGLDASQKTRDQEVVIAFELGNAYEQKKMHKDAITAYKRVQRIEPTYRDVEERIRRLEQLAPRKPSMRAAAVGADDDFDRAFDEMIGPGKKMS